MIGAVIIVTHGRSRDELVTSGPDNLLSEAGDEQHKSAFRGVEGLHAAYIAALPLLTSVILSRT